MIFIDFRCNQLILWIVIERYQLSILSIAQVGLRNAMSNTCRKMVSIVNKPVGNGNKVKKNSPAQSTLQL